MVLDCKKDTAVKMHPKSLTVATTKPEVGSREGSVPVK